MKITFECDHERFLHDETVLLGRTLALLSKPDHRFEIVREERDMIEVIIEQAQVEPVFALLSVMTHAFPDRTYWVTFDDGTAAHSMKVSKGECIMTLKPTRG